jgi:hypothetical protein
MYTDKLQESGTCGTIADFKFKWWFIDKATKTDFRIMCVLS